MTARAYLDDTLETAFRILAVAKLCLVVRKIR